MKPFFVMEHLEIVGDHLASAGKSQRSKNAEKSARSAAISSVSCWFGAGPAVCDQRVRVEQYINPVANHFGFHMSPISISRAPRSGRSRRAASSAQ
jgi:hypothetical protein